MIDTNNLSGIRIMSSDKEKKLFVRNKFYNRGKHGDYLSLQPIYDAIGHQFGSQITIKDRIIICEGVTDMLYILAFCEILHRRRPSIAPARGDGQIAHLLSFMIAQGFRSKIIIDKGEVRTKLQLDFGIDDKFIYQIPVPDEFASGTDRTGIEDLFSKEDFPKVLEVAGLAVPSGFYKTTNSNYVRHLPGYSMKRILAHAFFENAQSMSEKEFDEITLTGVKQLIGFCDNSEWFSI